MSEDEVTLIDLSALRDRFSDWDFLTDRARSIILAFDAYLTVPGVSPSTSFDRSEKEPSRGN